MARKRSKWYEDLGIGWLGSYLGGGTSMQSGLYGAGAAGLASLVRGKKDPFRSAVIGGVGGAGGRFLLDKAASADWGLTDKLPEGDFKKGIRSVSEWKPFGKAGIFNYGGSKIDDSKWTKGQQFKLALARAGRSGGGSDQSFMSKYGPMLGLGTAAYALAKSQLEEDAPGDEEKQRKMAEQIKNEGNLARAERKWLAGDPEARAKWPTLEDLRVDFRTTAVPDPDMNIARPGEDPVYAADGGYIRGYADGGLEGLGSLMSDPMTMEAPQYDAGALSEVSPQDIKKQIAEWLVVNGEEPTEDAIMQKAREWGVSIPASDESRAAMQRQAIEDNGYMPDVNPDPISEDAQLSAIGSAPAPYTEALNPDPMSEANMYDEIGSAPAPFANGGYLGRDVNGYGLGGFVGFGRPSSVTSTYNPSVHGQRPSRTEPLSIQELERLGNSILFKNRSGMMGFSPPPAPPPGALNPRPNLMQTPEQAADVGPVVMPTGPSSLGRGLFNPSSSVTSTYNPSAMNVLPPIDDGRLGNLTEEELLDLTEEELLELIRQQGMGRKFMNTGGYATGGSPMPKRDDIPAMLSRGEFVMTKNAVDAAGGPRPMYDLMHNLEGRA